MTWLLPLMTDAIHLEVPSEEVSSKIQVVLEGFPDVFYEPKGLPPPRSHDHHIELTLGSTSNSVRPY